MRLLVGCRTFLDLRVRAVAELGPKEPYVGKPEPRQQAEASVEQCCREDRTFKQVGWKLIGHAKGAEQRVGGVECAVTGACQTDRAQGR